MKHSWITGKSTHRIFYSSYGGQGSSSSLLAETSLSAWSKQKSPMKDRGIFHRAFLWERKFESRDQWRFPVFRCRTIISHVSFKRGFRTQSRGGTPHGLTFVIRFGLLCLTTNKYLSFNLSFNLRRMYP